ncbi:MAG: putative colanic acid biosynthesis acetyltransferase [Hymenobacter sp.]|nr:MAG: putative colanic acid biosynthesis acetyltransferase [Hymenobacter sp.]
MSINTDTVTGPSFSVRNRLGRLAWGVTSAVLFRLSPRPLHGWRSFLLRCFGAKVGAGVHVYPGANIWAPWNLELADECAIASGVTLYSQGKITVGYRAVVSQGAHLVTGTHDYNTPGFILITKPIRIGAHAWVAAEAFIHPGVTVGAGCVIGARSVVTRDMPEWTVCAGHPCLALKPRTRIDLPVAALLGSVSLK